MYFAYGMAFLLAAAAMLGEEKGPWLTGVMLVLLGAGLLLVGVWADVVVRAGREINGKAQGRVVRPRVEAGHRFVDHRGIEWAVETINYGSDGTARANLLDAESFERMHRRPGWGR